MPPEIVRVDRDAQEVYEEDDQGSPAAHIFERRAPVELGEVAGDAQKSLLLARSDAERPMVGAPGFEPPAFLVLGKTRHSSN